MKASNVAAIAFLACACAEGYGAPEIGRQDNASLAPMAGMLGLPVGGEAATSGDGMGGGTSAPPAGEPCLRDDVMPCACEGSSMMGQRACRFDAASPTQGFFGECQGCMAPEAPPAEPEPLCTDGQRNGAETGVDCGGTECPPCASEPEPTPEPEPEPMPEPMPEPTPDASVGEEPPPPDEPVRDCEGYPEGTECDRDCILPSNTARCTSRGTCSCLG